MNPMFAHEVTVTFSMFPVSPLYTRNPWTVTLENSEDQDEMAHNATFYQSLHCFHR